MCVRVGVCLGGCVSLCSVCVSKSVSERKLMIEQKNKKMAKSVETDLKVKLK